MLLKELVKAILSEGPEDMLGHSYMSPNVMGPFIVFRGKDNKAHYAFSYADDGSWTTTDTGDVLMHTQNTHPHGDTHGTVVNAIQQLFDVEVGRQDYDAAVHGRVWNIHGKYYVGLWNSIDQLQAFGMRDFINMLKKLMKDEFNTTNPKKVIIQPWTDSDETLQYMSFYDLEHGGPGKEVDKEKQDWQHKLHLMAPAEKAKILRKMGVQPKVGTVPDWMKKAQAGIDESNLLTELIRQILCEGKASSFLKFYSEIQRGYNPDKAVIWECLMTLRDYYRDYIGWYQAYPNKQKEDKEVYPFFIKRLQEIEVALRSDDIKRQIIAVDNGINQWHIDYPVVYHLQMDAEAHSDDEDMTSPENVEIAKWFEVGELLDKLGKLPKKSPYKRHYLREGWGGVIQTQNFWLDKNGKWQKVSSHGWYAQHLSGIESMDGDEAYQWMFDRGWAKVIVENTTLYVTTTRWGGHPKRLTKYQKDAIIEKAMQGYNERLEIESIPDNLMDL